MIVPLPRLIFLTLVVLAPVSFLATLLPGFALLPPLLFGGVLLLVIADLLIGMSRLDAVTVDAPPLLRTTRGAEFPLDLSLRSRSERCRIALEWPEAIEADVEEIDVRTAGVDSPKRVSWRCRAFSRGVWRIERCAIEIPAPLGLMAFRKIAPLSVEVRVYPDLTDEKKQAPAVFLTRGGMGAHAYRYLGKGREFETLREYVAGDTYADIHWKATARRSRPVTKIYQIERTQEVYAIIDAARLSMRRIGGEADARGMGGERFEIIDFYIRAAMTLQIAAARQNDLFGLGVFSDRMDGFMRSGAGPAHMNLCRNLLFHQRARAVTPDFMDVFGFLRSRIRRRALIFILTSLDDPGISDHFTRHIETVARKHLVVAAMMRPGGAQPLFSSSVDETGDIARHLSGHVQWQKLRELEQVLQRKGVQFMLMDHPKTAVQLLERYLQIRHRQLL